MDSFKHTPVMLDECIEGLNINPNGVYVDCTLGMGGHTSVIASKLVDGKLVSIDKDINAINHSSGRFKDNVTLVHSDFKEYKSVLNSLGIDGVDGVLIDLGVSSYQIDTAERGFSYRFDGPLDMRMDTTSSFSAYDVVNTYSKEELYRILKMYGEEDFANAIANKIISVRENAPIKTTNELRDIVESAIPRKFVVKGGASKKTFQAIRIEVNGELSGLDTCLEDIISSLKVGGRLCVLTFHSLEDRIAKNVFKTESTDCICDKTIPVCVCNHKARIKLVNRKPITASSEELKNNTRSACAKLRIVERI